MITILIILGVSAFLFFLMLKFSSSPYPKEWEEEENEELRKKIEEYEQRQKGQNK